MGLIDQSYFRGDINIPGTNSTAVSERLTWFCEKLETELLQKLLGYSLWKAFNDGIGAQAPDQKWIDIRDGKEFNDVTGSLRKWRGLRFTQGTAKRSVIALNVYFWWMRDNASQSTTIGETQSETENGIKVSPAVKMCRAWNEMVLWIEELILFLNSNKDTYPEWEKVNVAEIRKDFRPINPMGI